jgi:hypothetical protein
MLYELPRRVKMPQWLRTVVLCLAFPSVLLLWSGAPVAAQTTPGSAPEAKDMVLVGYSDLQGRSAYQPIIQQQGERFIAYIGHHGGAALNPLHGQTEPNGTSIVEVTDPRNERWRHSADRRSQQTSARRSRLVGAVRAHGPEYPVRTARPAGHRTARRGPYHLSGPWHTDPGVRQEPARQNRRLRCPGQRVHTQ